MQRTLDSEGSRPVALGARVQQYPARAYKDDLRVTTGHMSTIVGSF